MVTTVYLAMLQRLRFHLQEIQLEKFLLISALGLFVSDILNIVYVNQKLTGLMIKWIPMALSINGYDPSSIGPQGIREIAELNARNFSNIFFIFMVFHTIIYIFLYKRKKMAIKYSSGYSLVGAIFTIAMLPLMINMGDYLWLILMILITVLYLYIFLGLRFFKKSLE